MLIYACIHSVILHTLYRCIYKEMDYDMDRQTDRQCLASILPGTCLQTQLHQCTACMDAVCHDGNSIKQQQHAVCVIGQALGYICDDGLQKYVPASWRPWIHLTIYMSNVIIHSSLILCVLYIYHVFIYNYTSD